LEGEGVVLMVGVGVMVGVLVNVPVEVVDGIRLGVVEPVGVSGVWVKARVRVPKKNGVMDEVAVGVPEAEPRLSGARRAATAPAK
jgi:hypothetical protein